MDSFKSAVYVSMKRPGAFTFICFLTFILSNIETYLILGPMNFMINMIFQGKGSFFDTVMVLIQTIVTQGDFITKVLIVLLILFLVAVIISFVLSGYLFLINNIIDKKRKATGEFVYGVKKYFGRVFSATLRAIVVFTLILIILMVGIVPALVTTNALLAKSMNMLFLVIILDVITIVMLFFGLMFSRTYISFWYPSIFSFRNDSFKIAKKSVDKYFWDVVEKFVLFDIVFVVCQFLYVVLFNFLNSVPLISYFPVLFNWVFKTMFIIAFITYLFRSFRYYAEGSTGKQKKGSNIKYNDLQQNEYIMRQNPQREYRMNDDYYQDVNIDRINNEGKINRRRITRKDINKNRNYNDVDIKRKRKRDW